MVIKTNLFKFKFTVFTSLSLDYVIKNDRFRCAIFTYMYYRSKICCDMLSVSYISAT